MISIYVPEKTGIFKIAADEFASYYTRMTGDKVKIVTKPAAKGDMVVFGSDAVNAYTHSKIVDKTISQFSIMTDSDEYQIVSAEENGRNLLFIAGGRARAMLYAVYHFFEKHLQTDDRSAPNHFDSEFCSGFCSAADQAA